MRLRLADRDDGTSVAAAPLAKPMEQAELRDAQKRIRLLEQENEVLRRATTWIEGAYHRNDANADSGS